MAKWLRSIFRREPRRDDAWGGRVCLAADDRGAISERYSLAAVEVSPIVHPLTVEEYRSLISRGMTSGALRETPATKVSRIIGSDEDGQTVRAAKVEETTLRGDLAWNLLLVDDCALDPLAAHFGKMLVDVDPRPINWPEVGALASELSAAILQAMAKGRVGNGDVPKLRRLLRQLITSGQGAMIG